MRHSNSLDSTSRSTSTLKEQVFHGRVFMNVEEVRVAITEFKERYNLHWRLEKMGFMSPLEVRQAYAMRKRPDLQKRVQTIGGGIIAVLLNGAIAVVVILNNVEK